MGTRGKVYTPRVHDEDMFTTTTNALVSQRSCVLCNHTEVRRLGLRGVGRGSGMREGNKMRGRMIQHFKTEHAAEHAEIKRWRLCDVCGPDPIADRPCVACGQ